MLVEDEVADSFRRRVNQSVKIERRPAGQSSDHLVKRSLKTSQSIGSVNMDSLFIAKIMDIGTSRCLLRSNGEDGLKVASSKK